MRLERPWVERLPGILDVGISVERWLGVVNDPGHDAGDPCETDGRDTDRRAGEGPAGLPG